jgi:mono/diheme cytochrome c family protein
MKTGIDAMKTRFATLLASCVLLPFALNAWAQGDAKRGEYLSHAAGCLECHTDEAKGATPYAGGHALKTPFGTFYGPNITPHNEAGIGKWTEADFINALRHGKRPDGANYFPAFPYPSFTAMTDADMRDLFAYLKSLPANAKPSKPHNVGFPYNVRLGVSFWKMLYFMPGEFKADPKASAQVNRGAYLSTALGHCGECHTARTRMGGMRKDRHFAGATGPDGKGVPNITPAGLKKWRDKDLIDFLGSGITADGDEPAKAMGDVIRNTTGKLTPEDLAAMIAYLRSIPAIESEKAPEKKK